jgi:hypothetical protein
MPMSGSHNLLLKHLHPQYIDSIQKFDIEDNSSLEENLKRIKGSTETEARNSKQHPVTKGSNLKYDLIAKFNNENINEEDINGTADKNQEQNQNQLLKNIENKFQDNNEKERNIQFKTLKQVAVKKHEKGKGHKLESELGASKRAPFDASYQQKNSQATNVEDNIMLMNNYNKQKEINYTTFKIHNGKKASVDLRDEVKASELLNEDSDSYQNISKLDEKNNQEVAQDINYKVKNIVKQSNGPVLNKHSELKIKHAGEVDNQQEGRDIVYKVESRTQINPLKSELLRNLLETNSPKEGNGINYRLINKVQQNESSSTQANLTKLSKNKITGRNIQYKNVGNFSGNIQHRGDKNNTEQKQLNQNSNFNEFHGPGQEIEYKVNQKYVSPSYEAKEINTDAMNMKLKEIADNEVATENMKAIESTGTVKNIQYKVRNMYGSQIDQLNDLDQVDRTFKYNESNHKVIDNVKDTNGIPVLEEDIKFKSKRNYTGQGNDKEQINPAAETMPLPLTEISYKVIDKEGSKPLANQEGTGRLEKQAEEITYNTLQNKEVNIEDARNSVVQRLPTNDQAENTINIWEGKEIQYKPIRKYEEKSRELYILSEGNSIERLRGKENQQNNKPGLNSYNSDLQVLENIGSRPIENLKKYETQKDSAAQEKFVKVQYQIFRKYPVRNERKEIFHEVVNNVDLKDSYENEILVETPDDATKNEGQNENTEVKNENIIINSQTSKETKSKEGNNLVHDTSFIRPSEDAVQAGPKIGKLEKLKEGINHANYKGKCLGRKHSHMV